MFEVTLNSEQVSYIYTYLYSSILFEFWMHVKDVKGKEPDSYGHCVREGLSKPRPMGPYDGLKFFIQSCPVDDVLFLSFLRHKDRKKRRRADESHDSGERQ